MKRKVRDIGDKLKLNNDNGWHIARKVRVLRVVLMIIHLLITVEILFTIKICQVNRDASCIMIFSEGWSPVAKTRNVRKPDTKSFTMFWAVVKGRCTYAYTYTYAYRRERNVNLLVHEWILEDNARVLAWQKRVTRTLAFTRFSIFNLLSTAPFSRVEWISKIKQESYMRAV